jgi:hypothetical protein
LTGHWLTARSSASANAAKGRVTYLASSTSIDFAYTTVSDSDNDAARKGVDNNEYVAILIFVAVGCPLAFFCSLWFLSKCLQRIR